MKDKNTCSFDPDRVSPQEAGNQVVDAWNESTKDDVLGSYSGTDENGEAPVQDADDL